MRTLLTAATRVGVAAAGGATAAAAYAIATGLALDAQSRAWEMGAIPFVLAGFVFVGLLGGLVAGLAYPARPYLASLLAMVVLFVVADQINARREALTPDLTPDERREFWANIQGFLFAGGPLGIVCALWGGLLVDPRPGRWRGPRDVSLMLAACIGMVALIPAAVHGLGWQVGLIVTAAVVIAAFAWIARRNGR